jgi:EmrB/QacA subfamily drug resistance transporter
MGTPAKRLTLFTVSLALFMDVLDTNIINTSIPSMARSLQVNPIDLKIALISYLLSLAIFIPMSGWAADKYGAKRIFICAFGLFTISSFWCGYAQSLLHLVISRSIQGIGGAFMVSLGRLIVARTFKRHELVEAMNTVIMVVSIAVMVGPFIGGFITDHFSWPWIFWVNIPIGILGMTLAYLCIKDTTPRKPRTFDTSGFILFGGSLSLLCYSLSDISESHANLNSILALIILAITMMAAYFIHAKKIPHPVIQIRLLSIRTFQISVFGNLCARLGFGGMPFMLPLLQQVVLGFNAQLSGLLLAPMAFGIVFSKIIAIKVLRVTGYKKYLLGNTILVALVLWSFQIITPHTSIYTIACMTFIFGIFLSAQFTGMNSLAFSDIAEDDLSASTSITSTVQVLAQTLGVAVGAMLLRYFSSLTNQTATLTNTAFHQAFFTMGMLTLLSSLIFLRLKADDGKQMLRVNVAD